MAGQTELLLARARERFVVQDYYGAVHLLESVVDSGRAFADVHHLLGVSLSLLGQAERALGELKRALELNPQYVEALIHQGLVLNELGRTEEAQEAFGRAAEHLSKPTAGLPAPVAAQLANRHAELAETYANAGAIERAIAQYQSALELGPEFHDLRYRMARLLLEAGRPLEAREALEEVVGARPNFVDAEAALGLAHYLSGDAGGARSVWQACLARRPENARVEAYLAMLSAGSVRLGSPLWVVAMALLAGCGKAGDHERLGDKSYGEGRYAPALAEYRLGLEKDPDPRLWAKAGAAALRTGNLEVASDAYLRLAAEDPTRAEEAAEGLESVARAAERAGDARRLQGAVVGLGAIAPDRSTGRYALDLIRRPGAEATDLVAVLPGAIAVAPDPETVDSLLVVYGAALRETSGCGEALPAFQASLRRTRIAALRSRAEEGVAGCSLSLGLRAEATGMPKDAALWFAAAIRIDSNTTVGRRALVGYGDARLRLGDSVAGVLAYRTVVSDAVQTDSIYQMALDRLEGLRGSAPFDSVRTILR